MRTATRTEVAELRSGRHAGPGSGLHPVAEAADVGDTVTRHGEDLPALGRSACFTGGWRAGDVQPHQKRPGARGHLSDHGPYAGDSRAGPPGDDLGAVAAPGVAGILWRTPAGIVPEQIPDRVKITGIGAHGLLVKPRSPSAPTLTSHCGTRKSG